MKVIGWMVKLMVTAALSSLFSVMIILYLVNAYVGELLGPDAAALVRNKFELSEFVAKLWTGTNIVGQKGGSPRPGEERTPGNDPTTTETKTNTDTTPDDAVAVWSQTGLERDRVILSPEQFLTKRGKLTDEDKMTVYALLSKLPEKEMQQISTKLEEGITEAELQEMETIVETYLTPEEYAKLVEIVTKV